MCVKGLGGVADAKKIFDFDSVKSNFQINQVSKMIFIGIWGVND